MCRSMKAHRRNQSQYNAAASEEEAALDKPTPEEIAERAHDHFEAGGSQHGNDLDHWLSAEADLRAERNL